MSPRSFTTDCPPSRLLTLKDQIDAWVRLRAGETTVVGLTHALKFVVEADMVWASFLDSVPKTASPWHKGQKLAGLWAFRKRLSLVENLKPGEFFLEVDDWLYSGNHHPTLKPKDFKDNFCMVVGVKNIVPKHPGKNLVKEIKFLRLQSSTIEVYYHEPTWEAGPCPLFCVVVDITNNDSSLITKLAGRASSMLSSLSKTWQRKKGA